MDLKTLKDIVKVAKDEGVAELKVESKDFKVSVSFISGVAPVVHSAPMVHTAAPIVSAAPAQVSHPAAGKPGKVATDGLHVIKSPFVGTFYGSPSPSKPIYVKLGDKVKAGQPLCVLEAMKIMNEIESDIAGEIIEICVENESLVEFGQPLFKIKPF